MRIDYLSFWSKLDLTFVFSATEETESTTREKPEDDKDENKDEEEDEEEEDNESSDDTSSSEDSDAEDEAAADDEGAEQEDTPIPNEEKEAEEEELGKVKSCCNLLRILSVTLLIGFEGIMGIKYSKSQFPFLQDRDDDMAAQFEDMPERYHVETFLWIFFHHSGVDDDVVVDK